MVWFLIEIIFLKNNFIIFDYILNEFYYSDNFFLLYFFQDICGYEVVFEFGGVSFIVSFVDFLIVGEFNECFNVNLIWLKVLLIIYFQDNLIVFNYNEDRKDVGGKLFKYIKVLKNIEFIKQVDFNYDMIEVFFLMVSIMIIFVEEKGINYRMFLKEVIFKGNMIFVNYEKYLFEYYNID